MFSLLILADFRVLKESRWTWLGCHLNKPWAVNIYSVRCRIRTFHWPSSLTPILSHVLSRLTVWKRAITLWPWATQTVNGWAWVTWCGCWRTWTRRGLTSRWSAWWTAILQWYAMPSFLPSLIDKYWQQNWSLYQMTKQHSYSVRFPLWGSVYCKDNLCLHFPLTNSSLDMTYVKENKRISCQTYSGRVFLYLDCVWNVSWASCLNVRTKS